MYDTSAAIHPAATSPSRRFWRPCLTLLGLGYLGLLSLPLILVPQIEQLLAGGTLPPRTSDLRSPASASEARGCRKRRRPLADPVMADAPWCVCPASSRVTPGGLVGQEHDVGDARRSDPELEFFDAFQEFVGDWMGVAYDMAADDERAAGTKPLSPKMA